LLDRRTIAVSATFTAEPISESLCFLLEKLGLSVKVEFAPYNQIFQQLLDPSSLILANQRGLNVLLLRLEDWSNSEWSPAGNCIFPDNALENVRRNATDFVQAMRSAIPRAPAPFLVVLCPVSATASQVPDLTDDLDGTEDWLRSELEAGGAQCVTSKVLAALYPVAEYDDPQGNRLAHIPYTPAGFASLGAIVARRTYRAWSPAPKVIVLDCDQTLWRGVCGEDGPMGVEIDAPRKALQHFMVQQHDAGRLICLCSRNNEPDVVEVFERRPEMFLKREHIISWRINWEMKSVNLRSLAGELNLGLDSFIFVDDDPAVCLEVRKNCPGVLTLQLPAEPAEIPRFLNHVWAFDCSAQTREDKERTKLYEENIKREQLRGETSSLEEFIASLALEVEIAELRPETLSRVSQLTQRTNQFNFTTLRYSEQEIQRLCEAGWKCLTASVKDRFGDYGLVGVMIFGEDKSSLEIDTFLLSCRALGRGVEHRMLAQLGSLAVSRGLNYVDLRYRESAKNRPAFEFASQLQSIKKEAPGDEIVFRVPARLACELTFNANGHALKSAPAGLNAPQTRQEKPFAHSSVNRSLYQIATELHDAQKILSSVKGEKERSRPLPAGTLSAPRDEVERRLKTIWESNLNVHPIGVEDDYFELGGDSFKAVALFVEIENEFGQALPLTTLLKAPTIRRIGDLLREDKKESAWSALVPLQPEGTQPPLYCMHAAGGDVLFYRDLARHLGRDQPVYGLQARGMSRIETTHNSVEEMAAYYLDAIRAFQPQGPYYLGGSSFGGLVAFEMARQLDALGQPVGLLALFDTYAPGYPKRLHSLMIQARIDRLIDRFHTIRENLSLLSPREKIQYLTAKAKKAKKMLWRKFAWKKNEFAIKFSTATGKPLPADLQRNHKAIAQALRDYKPKPYHGELTLFRAKTQPAGIVPDETLGWNELALGGLRIYEVPGLHGVVTVDPHAKFLAEKLAPCLASAQQEVGLSDRAA